MPSQMTPHQQLAEVLLGADLRSWVLDRRDPDDRRSWSTIARQLAKATGGQVKVTGEAVRQWYGDAESDTPAEVAS